MQVSPGWSGKGRRKRKRKGNWKNYHIIARENRKMNKKIKNKVSLQTSLEKKFSNFSYISFFSVNFENLTIQFHVPYFLNMHIKFRLNRTLFTLQSTNLFFIHNLDHKNLKF